MKIFFTISIIISLLYVIYKSLKAIHILQLNFYNEDNRYIKWILKNNKKAFINFDVLFIVFLILYFVNNSTLAIIIFIVLYMFSYVTYKNKMKKEQEKKPLVITSRVKRLLVTECIIYIILILPIFISFNIKYICFYYLYIGLLITINYLVIYITNIINKPIEKLVFNYYKSNAKNKLESMKYLKKIGITGSYGKTSVKNILNEILNVKYNSFATEKSFNTMNGLMISINNKLDKFSDIFISEMGAFRKGEIKELCSLIKPEYGILTTIGTAHLESFKTRENIRDAKFELIDSLPSDGIAILNMDDKYQTGYKIKSNCKKVWVSLKNKDADFYAYNISISSKGTKFKVKIKDKKEELELETNMLGEANIYNIVEAVALSYNLGLTLNEIKIGVKRVKSVSHRLELKKYKDINLIDDSYNSNPSGAKMALDVLDLMDGKKIIVTPGMIELGSKEYDYNFEFGKQIAKVCDDVILIGEKKTKPIYNGLKEEGYNEKNIHILNDVKKAFPLMEQLSTKETFVLLENDLPDTFNE